MSNIPSTPPPTSASPGVSIPSSPGAFNENAMYAALFGQADAVGASMNSYYEEIQKLTAELNKVNGAIGDLNNLASECNGANGTVNTSSLQSEMKALGIDLPNPANASQIKDAVSSAQNLQSTLGSQSTVDQDKMQMEMANYNTILQEISSICEALTQTSQGIVKNMA